MRIQAIVATAFGVRMDEFTSTCSWARGVVKLF